MREPMPNPEVSQRTEEARWAKIFKALGHPLRYRLYLEASTRPLTVSELVALSGRSQPAVSQYLNALRRAGLVRVTRRGRNMIYEAQPVDWNALSALKVSPVVGGPVFEAAIAGSGEDGMFPEFSPASAPVTGTRETSEDFLL